MPWVPEYFSAPALEQLEERRRDERIAHVSYFGGIMAGEVDALIRSFDGEPQVHDPIRGRIKGEQAFAAFVTETNTWMGDREVSIEHVAVVVTESRGVEEVVLHIDGDAGRVDLPVAIAADRLPGGHIEELRIYFSAWPLTGRHVNRPPLLQRDPELSLPDVVDDYQRALAAGDLDGILATFESGGYAREPAGARYLHDGPDRLRSFYEQLFSNGGGIPLEHCAVTDDGHTRALEYNVVRWGQTELLPQAGIAVYERGEDGKLAAARVYDDCEPPLGSPASR